MQSVDAILEDSAALIERWHDPSYGSMRQIALAPCSPFSVSRELLLQSAKLARQYHVRLHTHLAETKDEERYTLVRYGLRPLAYLESLGWVGPDVWFAHGIHFTDTELDLLAETRNGRGALPRFQHEALLRRGAHPRDAAARHPRRPLPSTARPHRTAPICSRRSASAICSIACIPLPLRRAATTC